MTKISAPGLQPNYTMSQKQQFATDVMADVYDATFQLTYVI